MSSKAKKRTTLKTVKKKPPSVYAQLIAKIFFDHWEKGKGEIEFAREELEKASRELGVKLPKNIGDAIYSFRYRRPLPDEIKATATKGREWIIEGAGRAKYRFRQVKTSRLLPRDDLVTIKIPDATPEVIRAYALSDEQALLARVRYNRLIDIFLGLTAFSLQNHLRTTVTKIGQVEIDEIYVGIDSGGVQYIVPVQAKGGTDQLSPVQTSQDIACCAEKFPDLVCRPISTQFKAEDLIVIFELADDRGEVKVVKESHYNLVPAEQISSDELRDYRKWSGLTPRK